MLAADSPIIAQRVRAAALWAGIAAAIMLGYTYLGGEWSIIGDGAFRTGANIFAFALEFGGWAMAVVTLCLLTGRRPALAFDAAVSAIIGALFIAGGLLMLSGGGLQAMLTIVFGIMFVSAARNSWRDYGGLGRRKDQATPIQVSAEK